jgi:CheY-like chemotaxis protein
MGEGPGVIISEDEVIIALLIERQLRRLGCRILAKVRTGEALLDAFESHGADLLLLDIRLGGSLSGIEVARRVRSSSKVPIAFMTAYGSEEVREEAAGVEPIAFLEKPVSEDELACLVALVGGAGSGAGPMPRTS